MPNNKIENLFFDRDLSWLSFNGRVLQEAAKTTLPVLEQIKFLSIYSSNLDEFYRVRMPVLLALEKLGKKEKHDTLIPDSLLADANQVIRDQLQEYGDILKTKIIPQLAASHINFVYNKAIPEGLNKEVSRYFLSHVLAFLQPINLNTTGSSFFPTNNELYFLITVKENEETTAVILNIPTSSLPRFYKIEKDNIVHIVFIDDIVRHNLPLLFKDKIVTGCFSFKITRDAEIDLKDEYAGNLADELEKQLQKRDFGLATRFLFEPGIPQLTIDFLVEKLNLRKANLVEGGRYHNLKDLSDFPIHIPSLSNPKWPSLIYPQLAANKRLYEEILKKDLLINPPYQQYDSILRFFNEAATDTQVSEIYVTLYRVASDSKIVNALMSAAKNGKKVFVLVELKARFDEANNIKWAKKMKEAGVEITYSATALKVHAKIALVKRTIGLRTLYTGLLATGNFNETTANFYTDHILITAHQEMLREMELVFIFLAKRRKPADFAFLKFNFLLVAQFNLQERFIALIDREINHAKQGKSAGITIKLNNLEEKVLISKLYEASQAGVKIALIVRGICVLLPGIKGMSEHITVRRIVDRYLEHGRIFVFHNNNKEEIYMGSADWMNRNIYRRIEVCFPVLDEAIKAELKAMLKLQLEEEPSSAQYRIYQLLKAKSNVE
ncbi:MAG: polyphosphate kinase 1 [Bacteroidota bacterium]